MEVREDMLSDDNDDPAVRKEFLDRSVSRYQALLQKGVCFIDDSSADRSWKQQPGDQYFQLKDHGYDYFIISMDLSADFIRKLHGANHSLSRDYLNKYYDGHQKFLEAYVADVALSITDDNFLRRMELCENAVSEFLKNRN